MRLRSCGIYRRARQERQSKDEVIIAGHWKQLKGKLQAKWGDLRDDDTQVAEGNTDYLVGKLQERYGWDRDRARIEASDFERDARTSRNG